MKTKISKFLSVLLVVAMLLVALPNRNTIVKADTAEYAMFPGSTLWVTQGAYGEFNSYSHNGQGGYVQNAFDLGGNDNYRAPFSGTITQIKTSYNAVILQSDNKVYWANGTYDYMSVCFVHDNNISDLYVGKHLNQGDIFYQPGIKDPGGYTTGAHVHICVNVGKTNNGISIFSGDTRPNEAFYLDTNTAIRETGNYNWKTKNHVHNYDTYVYFWKEHPHYNCYKCSCGEIKENTNEPNFSETCEQCIEACKPKNVSVATDKQSYNVGETVTVTPSGEGAKYYTIRIYYGGFGDDNIEYSDFAGFTGNKEFVPLKEGTYTVAISAVGERGYYSDAECTFSVEGEMDPTKFSSWSSVLPGNISETDYDIETKTMYRYRNNTTTTQYGAWGANQTTSRKPTESATLQIVSTTKYYNYYHYCCNYYDGTFNVDSIECGTGSILHTYQTTTELSPTNVGDQGKKTLYGNHACPKDFLVWAKDTPYETYIYTYRTRTATQVTANGAWSSWQDTKPSTAENRDIEEQTCYRYKLKAHQHTESGWIIDRQPLIGVAGSKHKECTVCLAVLETEDIPAIILTDENAPQIIIENKKVRPGAAADVKISLKNNPGIASLKIRVIFPDDLILTNIAYNSDIGGQFQPPQTTDSPVILNWYNGTENANGDFVFATLTFKASDTAQFKNNAITVTFNPDDVYNISETNIDFTVVGGNIEVISYLPGDINDDGSVNNKDLTRLFQYLSEWKVTVNEAALDVNGDGKINNKDITRLFQYLSDWDVKIF